MKFANVRKHSDVIYEVSLAPAGKESFCRKSGCVSIQPPLLFLTFFFPQGSYHICPFYCVFLSRKSIPLSCYSVLLFVENNLLYVFNPVRPFIHYFINVNYYPFTLQMPLIIAVDSISKVPYPFKAYWLRDAPTV
jgi:hypothetical protein